MKIFIIGVSWVTLLMLFYKIESSVFSIWIASLIFLGIVYMKKFTQFANLLLLLFLLFMIVMVSTKIELPVFLIIWISSPVFFATLYMKKCPQFTISSLAVFLLFTIAFLLEKSQHSTGALIFVFLPIYSIIFGVIVQYLASLFDEPSNYKGDKK